MIRYELEPASTSAIRHVQSLTCAHKSANERAVLSCNTPLRTPRCKRHSARCDAQGSGAEGTLSARFEIRAEDPPRFLWTAICPPRRFGLSIVLRSISTRTGTAWVVEGPNCSEPCLGWPSPSRKATYVRSAPAQSTWAKAIRDRTRVGYIARHASPRLGQRSALPDKRRWLVLPLRI